MGIFISSENMIEYFQEAFMIKAIIFDMDGVLFDTENFYFKRRETFLGSKGISVKHLPPKYFIGGRMDQFWENILGDKIANYDTKALEAEYTVYKNTHRPAYDELVFADASTVLATLTAKGIVLALASNSAREDVEDALEKSGLKQYFTHILSGSEFAEGKPNPAIYNAACEKLGFAKKDIVIIEDSQKGIQAGVAAGVRVLAIRDKVFGVDQSKADVLIDSLTEALQFVENENHNSSI